MGEHLAATDSKALNWLKVCNLRANASGPQKNMGIGENFLDAGV